MYTLTHTHAHIDKDPPQSIPMLVTISGHSQTFRIPVPIELNSVLNSCDTLQAISSVCYTFWRLTDSQDLGANQVKFYFTS